METKTKILIGFSALAIVAFATKKYWLPKKKEVAVEPVVTEPVVTEPSAVPVTPKPVVPKPVVPKPVPPPIEPKPYDVTTDNDYASKMIVLKALFSKTMGAGVAGSAINKGDNYNKLATIFLPVSLSDLKIYSTARMTDPNSPINIGKANIIRNKYPTVFSKIDSTVMGFSRGVDGSSSFSGNNELSNNSLSNL